VNRIFFISSSLFQREPFSQVTTGPKNPGRSLSGEFVIDGTTYKPGTLLFHPDPHFEGEFKTATGGDILIVQYPGPSTHENPIYAGRFNISQRRSVSEERVDL
jgi:hypothetical protein